MLPCAFDPTNFEIYFRMTNNKYGPYILHNQNVPARKLARHDALWKSPSRRGHTVPWHQRPDNEHTTAHTAKKGVGNTMDNTTRQHLLGEDALEGCGQSGLCDDSVAVALA